MFLDAPFEVNLEFAFYPLVEGWLKSEAVKEESQYYLFLLWLWNFLFGVVFFLVAVAM